MARIYESARANSNQIGDLRLNATSKHRATCTHSLDSFSIRIAISYRYFSARGGLGVCVGASAPPEPVSTMLLHGAVARRRLQGKQRAVPYPTPSPAAAAAALACAAENCAVLCADGLLPLPLDQRRRHAHWTQCRTLNPEDAQPCQLSREEFWNHLVRC